MVGVDDGKLVGVPVGLTGPPGVADVTAVFVGVGETKIAVK